MYLCGTVTIRSLVVVNGTVYLYLKFLKMTYCVVKSCSSSSDKHTKKDGITFHLFPQDANRREKWIAVMRTQRCEHNWVASKSDVICSNHFNENDMYTTENGLRRIKKEALPIFVDLKKMESVESPLEVLSRAATMVQHCRTYSNSEHIDDAESVNGNSPCGSHASASPPSSNETTSSGIDAASAKQPSSKWRRERRCTTRIPDYKNRETNLVGNNKALRSQSFNDKSLSKVHLEPISRTRSGDNNLHHSDSDLSNYDEKNNSDLDSPTTKKPGPFSSHKSTRSTKLPEYTETPLDMSVKMRSSPPSYSQSISNSLLYRPSVITQATNNGAPTTPTTPPIAGKGEYVPGSMSMCDPVIDEHFRRSLGADYMSLFGKNKEGNGVANGKTQKVATKDRGSSPIMFPSDPCSKFLNPATNPTKESTDPKVADKSDEDDEEEVEEEEEECKMEVDESEGLTVDDHFAKALGDTWKKLQKNIQKPEVTKNSDSKDLSNSNHDKKHSRSIVI